MPWRVRHDRLDGGDREEPADAVLRACHLGPVPRDHAERVLVDHFVEEPGRRGGRGLRVRREDQAGPLGRDQIHVIDPREHDQLRVGKLVHGSKNVRQAPPHLLVDPILWDLPDLVLDLFSDIGDVGEVPPVPVPVVQVPAPATELIERLDEPGRLLAGSDQVLDDRVARQAPDSVRVVREG